MTLSSWYLIAKKIHRLLVLVICITGLFMMITGVSMYAEWTGMFNPAFIRFLHNKLSILFTIVLGLMTVTGLYLFLFPYLLKRQKTTQTKK